MQVKPFSGDRKEGNIDALVKLYHETLFLIASIGHSGFEYYAGGTSKSYGEYQDE